MTLLVLAAILALAVYLATRTTWRPMPFVALVTSYVYLDARTRLELESVHEPDELPAKIQLSV